MSHFGAPNWPPYWTGPHGPGNPLPQGEVGTLTRVEAGSSRVIGAHFFIAMSWNDQEYVGCLFFDDENFMKKVYAALEGRIGWPIASIGSLDIP